MLEDRKRLKQETGSTQCKWSSRRLIEFAVHGSKPFVDQLRGLSIDMDSAGLKALEKLRQLGRHVDVSNILNGFATAKNVLESRFTQYTSFLHKPPWSFVALLEYLLPSTSMAETTKRSRVLTGKLLRLHDLNQIGNLGDVGREVFAKHRTALSRWAKGHDHFMQQQLFRQLVAWAFISSCDETSGGKTPSCPCNSAGLGRTFSGQLSVHSLLDNMFCFVCLIFCSQAVVPKSQTSNQSKVKTVKPHPFSVLRSGLLCPAPSALPI